ncbi:hypothetical protein O6B72_02045 [Campylobacter ureolyticus]|uniref:HNH/ENDO VII family nuclease n=1 Tax=Campylobacter ureolyticus TaxID=827 RepID=UPI0022B4B52C|nr:HNH/ENDO VII family nuclease [Campylobacter ureolyticus]MCZ6155601.1 hypothetical protein [Campylobacter ureolyticus]
MIETLVAIEKSLDKPFKEFKPKQNIENTDIDKYREYSNFKKQIVQEADTETAMNSSLSSVLEANKEKLETRDNKASEINESGEGLSDEEKKEIQEKTGWSDEVIESIRSKEEAEIYIKANLKEVEINGKKCLIRDDIDLDQADEDGITNRERMEIGRPPLTKNGEEVELHHIGQKQNSPLAELTTQEHRGVGNDAILHDKAKETEINRNEFAKERYEHWQSRLSSMEGE